MAYRLATKEIGENSAYAVGRSLSISFKEASEVCNFVRHRKAEKAKALLQKVIDGEMNVPFKTYNKDMAHKPGIAAGRQPVRCAQAILKLIKSAESNAQNKGLSGLVITHICAHKASTPWHYGRQRRRKMKRANVEVVLTQVKEK